MNFIHQLVERVGFSIESIFRYLFSLIPLFASDSSCTSCVISAKLKYIDCHKSAVSSCSLSVSVYRSVGFVISLLSLLSFFSFPSLLSFLPDICHSYIELRCVCVVCSFFFLVFPTFHPFISSNSSSTQLSSRPAPACHPLPLLCLFLFVLCSAFLHLIAFHLTAPQTDDELSWQNGCKK